MSELFNPRRLTLARKRRGMTKTLFARLTGVRTRTVSAWEHSEFEPEDERIEKIAQVLRFPRRFFFGDDLEEPTAEGVSFRALTKMTAAQREMALSAGAIAFALDSWIDKRFELPAADVPNFRGELDPEAAAQSLRQYWGLGEQPIKNIVHLLESKGIRVFSLSMDAREVDAFSAWHESRPFVFLNTKKSAERSRFDAAHELAHLVLHRHGVPQGQEAEREANNFASAFLMPRRSILAHAPKLPTIQNLIQSKKFWGVSVAALAYRLSRLKVVSEWHHRSLCIEIAKNGYRENEPQEGQRETSQVLSKVFSALRNEGISKANVADQLSLPVEEIDTLVFGLTLTGLSGDGFANRGNSRPNLRIVSERT
jgi:Zn-dependent peptidase ImmA (M78 family)/DNA-binding XRE family transcriptional regulator